MQSTVKKVSFTADTNLDDAALKTLEEVEVVCTDDGVIARDGSGDCGIFLGELYVSLDIKAESGRVTGFGGVINLSLAKKIGVSLPAQCEDAVLYAADGGFTSGSGVRTEIGSNFMYDDESGFLVFGDYASANKTYRFLKNGYAQLNSDGSLKSLLFTGVK